MDTSNTEITEELVIQKFRLNWAFWLFTINRINHWRFAITVPLVIFIIGGIFSAWLKVFYLYVTNWTLYLNLIGIALAFIAFGWFTQKLPPLLTLLADLFESNTENYLYVLDKWSKFANRNLYMVLVGAAIAVLNLIEIIKYWESTNPPILLIPWVNSEASIFFGIFYGFLHVIAVPFILGSGVIGMIGTIGLLRDLFKTPIDLVYYRRTEAVIGLTGWLLMWALIGLASILIFSRSVFVFSVDISWIKVSALLQSVPATLIVLGIGSAPLILIGNAIETAKNKERKYLERNYKETYRKFLACLSSDKKRQLQPLSEKLKILDERIQWINSIPTLPIRWPSIARISFGTVLSMFSPFIQDWWQGYLTF